MSDSGNDLAQNGARTCDLLVRNAYVLTMDARRTKFPDGAIAIDGRNIVAVGSDPELAAHYRPRRVIDAAGALVHPGIIEPHMHATIHMVSKLAEEMVGSTDDVGAWAAEQYTGLINAIDDEGEYANSLLAGLDMLRSGITMFADPGTAFVPDAIASAVEALGMRASVADPWMVDVRGPQFTEIAGVSFDRQECLDRLGGELRRNRDPDGLVRGHIALYGVGYDSDELILAAKACADENGVMFNMHQSQSVDDTAFDDKRLGRHPFVHFADIGLLDKNCVFVHMNVLREDEIEPVVESGMTIVWSPTNSWYWGTRQYHRNRIPELSRRGVNVAIGTDVCRGSSFGDQLFTAYLLARDQGDYLSPEDLLAMQTINGAKALRLDDRLGSLEVGKRADLVIRTNDLPEAWPRINVERQQLLLARARSVDTVIVGGQIALKGGRLTRLDEAVVYELAQKTAERMMAVAGR